MKYLMSLPYFPEPEIESILEEFRKILRGDAVLSMGPQVQAFEREFAEFVGTRYAVGTNSCSAALEIALRSIGLEPGDEVVVPVETFVATGSSVVREGGKAVFADIEPGTFCMSLETLLPCLGPKTKAVILVHMAGMISPDALRIRDACRERGIVLIEDAAHAHGASIQGLQAGSIGDIGCFSFYPTKMMTTGEGGMLVTNSEEIHRSAASYRSRGLDLSVKQERYSGLGTNNRMTEFAAILGRSQLRGLREFVARRQAIARVYAEGIRNSAISAWATPPSPPAGVEHCYWRYMVSLSPEISRTELKSHMAEREIVVDWPYDPPLHLQPVFQKLYGTRPGTMKAEEIMQHHVCLPMHCLLTEQDAQVIVRGFVESVENVRSSRARARS